MTAVRDASEVCFNPSVSMDYSGRKQQLRVFLSQKCFNPSVSMDYSGRQNSLPLILKRKLGFNPSVSMDYSGSIFSREIGVIPN